MPFLAPAIPWIAGLGGAAGALGKGRAAGRAAEAEQVQAADRQRLQAQQLALAQAAFNRQAPELRMGNATRGDILANVQPYELIGEGRNLRATGGLSPALLSAGTRQLGSAVSRQALLSQLAEGSGGPARPASPAGPRARGLLSGVRNRIANRTVAPPAVDARDPYTFRSRFEPTPLPQSGWLDKVLLGAGVAGNLLPFFDRSPKPDEENPYTKDYF